MTSDKDSIDFIKSLLGVGHATTLFDQKSTASLSNISDSLIAEGKRQTAVFVEKISCFTGDRITISLINELSASGKIPVHIYGDVVASLNRMGAILDDEPATLIVPYGVKTIPQEFFTFSEHSLSQVLLPDSVESIGDFAFKYNTNLSKIIIPKSVKSIAPTAFIGCSGLTSIEVAKDNKFYSGNGYLTDISGKKLVYCPENLHIGESLAYDSDSTFFSSKITEVGDYAFFHSKFHKISLPSLCRVGESSFAHSENLTELECRPIEKCGAFAFTICHNLAEFDFSELRSIPKYAFYGDESLKKANFSQQLSYIGDYAFAGATSLTDISAITAKEIGMSAFCSTNILKVELTNCVSLDTEAFSFCENLTEVSILSEVKEIPDTCFWVDTSLKKIQLNPHIKKIGSAAFLGCFELAEITLPSDLITIDKKAFGCCSSLTQVKIPPQVSNIFDTAFDSCDNLTRIEVDVNNRQYYDDNGVLYSYGANGNTLVQYPPLLEGDTFEVPDNITAIAENGFHRCKLLKSLVISDSVTDIHSTAFENSNIRSIHIGAGINRCDFLPSLKQLESITVSFDNASFASKNGVLFSSDYTSLLRYPPKKKDDLYRLRYEVTKIESYAFEGAEYLQHIEFNDGLKEILPFAFLNCMSLHRVHIPASVRVIADKALGFRLIDCDDRNQKIFAPIYDFRIIADLGTEGDWYNTEYNNSKIGPSEYPFDDEEEYEEYYDEEFDDKEGLL